jgi:hypothetical protein
MSSWLLSLLLLWAMAGAEQPVPALSKRLTDLTHTLAAGQQEALETRLAAFEREKGAQITVLIVETTEPEAIEQYGIRVADAWKIGRKGVDDGAILIVAKNDRKLRIEVGYGLEGALPDAIANQIIEEIIVPKFRQGDFYGGISAGLESIKARTRLGLDDPGGADYRRTAGIDRIGAPDNRPWVRRRHGFLSGIEPRVVTPLDDPRGHRADPVLVVDERRSRRILVHRRLRRRFRLRWRQLRRRGFLRRRRRFWGRRSFRELVR